MWDTAFGMANLLALIMWSALILLPRWPALLAAVLSPLRGDGHPGVKAVEVFFNAPRGELTFIQVHERSV